VAKRKRKKRASAAGRDSRGPSAEPKSAAGWRDKLTSERPGSEMVAGVAVGLLGMGYLIWGMYLRGAVLLGVAAVCGYGAWRGLRASAERST
jgi:F0F1-type ATP synthase assembly protein I